MTDQTVDAHQLIPPQLQQRIPGLYQTEDVNDPIVHLKWFTPNTVQFNTLIASRNSLLGWW